jgi:hypothetical protein
MLNGFIPFHHRDHSSLAPTPDDDSSSGRYRTGTGDQHLPHPWSKHTWEERRSKKRDASFRDLVELEAELLHEVEPNT